jgi:hypothetical protein
LRLSLSFVMIWRTLVSVKPRLQKTCLQNIDSMRVISEFIT